jgi:hypothetical protein
LYFVAILLQTGRSKRWWPEDQHNTVNNMSTALLHSFIKIDTSHNSGQKQNNKEELTKQ